MTRRGGHGGVVLCIVFSKHDIVMKYLNDSVGERQTVFEVCDE